MLAAGTGLLGAAAAHGGDAGAPIRNGGTFRIAVFGGTGNIDPALLDGGGFDLIDATCARLMTYPDKKPPEGFRLVPDVAKGYPRVSRDGKTYTFTLRSGFRFSNGAPVRASAFAWAITRTLKLNGGDAIQLVQDIVGADRVREGKTQTVAGIAARGNRLVIRLIRPAPAFPARMTAPWFCAVPPLLPADPEGVATFPAAGPYYVAENVRGRRIVLRRNRFYRGSRPHHFVKPGLVFRHYHFNTSRPLFRNNARLRRAVNFAVDRSAVRAAAGGRLGSRLTDQYLPPGLPGFRDARIYPLERPDLRRARELARGHTRSGKAVLYTYDVPFFIAAAQIIEKNLARIGLDVVVKGIPPSAYFQRIIDNPAEPWDIASADWAPDHLDPYTYLNLLLDGQFIRENNLSHFNSERYNRLLRRTARLQGAARYRAYGKLDVRLARDAAPIVAISYLNDATLVSKRVDRRCIVLRPTLDLTAVCLKRRTLISIALLAGGAGLIVAGATARQRAEVRNGGTFRITALARDFDSIDPALSYRPTTGALLDPTCARLFNYPDKPPPEGFRAVPEVAAGYPRVSRDGKTYAFTLRKGFRFSNGAPVRASAFARAINRMLNPAMNSPGVQYVQSIVGAEDVLAGKTASARGVVAKGLRLVVRFTRAVPDFPAQTTMLFFCAVSPTLPVDSEGVLTLPAAGPYYVAQQVRGQRLVLERNRFYRGKRPHHVDRFRVEFATNPGDVLDRIERGQTDWGWAPGPFYFDPARKLATKYGVNRSQFFVKPGLTLKAFALNTSRPLFRNNPKLRRAVNFAVDRTALQRVVGGRLAVQVTDQYLPPGLPGFKDAHIYPLARPNLAKAKRLARGHLRSGKAVLYIIDVAEEVPLGQILKQNLAKIGIAVEIKVIPPSAYFGRVGVRDEPFDIAWTVWAPDYLDPYTYIDTLLGGRSLKAVGNTNYAHFNSPQYNRLMARAARLRGSARSRAYGDLDVRLARDAAPMLSYAFTKEPTLVSKRVGCLVLRPCGR